MAQNSVILIDEMVLLDSGVHAQAAQMDMIMMTNFAALERTEKQWCAMLERAGLKIKRFWIYDASLRHGVIEAVLPRRVRVSARL